jgi:hypothetical protein
MYKVSVPPSGILLSTSSHVGSSPALRPNTGATMSATGLGRCIAMGVICTRQDVLVLLVKQLRFLSKTLYKNEKWCADTLVQHALRCKES